MQVKATICNTDKHCKQSNTREIFARTNSLMSNFDISIAVEQVCWSGDVDLKLALTWSNSDSAIPQQLEILQSRLEAFLAKLVPPQRSCWSSCDLWWKLSPWCSQGSWREDARLAQTRNHILVSNSSPFTQPIVWSLFQGQFRRFHLFREGLASWHARSDIFFNDEMFIIPKSVQPSR